MVPTDPSTHEVPPQAARLAPKLRALTDRGIYFGTSSWKYDGWLGSIYSEAILRDKRLELRPTREGLGRPLIPQTKCDDSSGAVRRNGFIGGASAWRVKVDSQWEP
jgi:hypothetical protein